MRKGSSKIVMALIALALIIIVSGTSALASEDKNIVQSIVVKGNLNVDTGTIKDVILKTKVGEQVEKQKLLDDLHSIYDLGYFQDAGVNYEPVFGGVQVVFEVEENPVVTEINVTGIEDVRFKDFEKEMKTQVGYILNVIDFGEDLYNLREWVALEYGYLTRVSELDADTKGRINVEFTQTKLKDIEIVGNKKTKDFVIERELSLKPGDPVNLQKIDGGLRKVLMLGFFDEISRDFSDEEDPDETVLTVNLEERKTGSATFGVAYSSNDGLVGFVEAADENFLGRGQRLKGSAQMGKKVKSYELGFHEPYIDKTGTSLGVNIYQRTEGVKKGEDDEKATGTRRTIGGDLTLGRPFGDYSRGRLTLKLENNKYDQETGPEEDWFKDYNNRSIGFGFSTNTTDHPFNPTRGYKNDSYLEFGTKLFGGHSNYAKLKLEYSRFFEIKDGGYVFALRGLGGRLLAGNLQENEKFKIGGADTLRGYSYGDEAFDLIGDHMFVMNGEFRFPIVEKITGVLFTDWGTTWNNEDSFSISNLKNSYGLGVRLDTPLGLLRLDYGRGKDKDDNRKGQFYFGIGQTF
ncbi:MAG TPA: BamA/TamA family outer membrane protein [Natronincola sp.]|nr:BamA/TamA family outer membrane protein [Natronincola sp.]